MVSNVNVLDACLFTPLKKFYACKLQDDEQAEGISSNPLSREVNVQDHPDGGNDIPSTKQQRDYTTLNSKERKRLASSSPLAPIWTVPAEPIFFDADRSTAKQLAKSLVTVSADQLLHL